MITIRKSTDRGHANHGWLDTYHTFSFSSYQNPEHIQFRSLRVINEDRIGSGAGFGTHGHRDMEIITYVLDGALEHKDNIGNGSIIQPGEVQRMSAGTGILHSEYNHSKNNSVHLYQIWIIPDEMGIQPSYEQKSFHVEKDPGKLHLVAAKGGKNGAVTVHQDMGLYAGVLKTGDRLSHALDRDRHAWIQVARGEITLNGISLKTSDGAAVSEETNLNIEATNDAEILLFDLA